MTNKNDDKKTDGTKPSAEFRQKAEERLKANQSKKEVALSEIEAHKLIHELEVHQIELEMQQEELKVAKELAEAASAKYTQLYDFAPSGYVTLSSIGEILSLNFAAARLLGNSRSNLIKKKFSTFLSNHTKQILGSFINALFQSQVTQTAEVEIALKDKPTVYLLFTGIADDSNSFCNITLTDITEQKKAEKEKKSLTNRLQLATTGAGMGIWDLNIKTNHLLWDEGMYRLYKVDKELFTSVYEQWISRIHPDDQERVHKEIQMSVAGKKIYDTEFRIMWADQSVHHIRSTGIMESDPDGNTERMIGLNWDITEQILSEIHLKQLNQDLKDHAENLALSNEELEQFAYVASHDLQEPLRMVTSFLMQLEHKYGDVIDDKGKKYIGFAVDGAQRMRQIILDLLEYSRVGRMDKDMEALDLNELMKEVKLLLRKKIVEKRAVFTIDPLPQVLAYRSPIRQVFQNLIGNALKYSRDDIPVQINISVKEKEYHWQFAVSDNGIGIDKENFEKIFIIFQKLHTREEYAGTGIGLAITKKIIEKQGGTIWVESEAGKGSTFYFTINK